MECPPRMAGKPGTHLGVLVGGVVVEDRVHQQALRYGGFDAVQETDELLVAVPGHALADHRTVEGYAYYGIAGNFRSLQKVHRAVERYWYKMLCSRNWAGRTSPIGSCKLSQCCESSSEERIFA